MPSGLSLVTPSVRYRGEPLGRESSDGLHDVIQVRRKDQLPVAGAPGDAGVDAFVTLRMTRHRPIGKRQLELWVWLELLDASRMAHKLNDKC